MQWISAPISRLGEVAVAIAKSKGAGFGRDKRGNIALITALVLPVLIGCLSLGFEGAFWYQQQRSAQNAADSAVLAASTNGSSTYDVEAKAVTAQYGFTDGQNSVSVTALRTPACPGGAGPTCYTVTVSKVVPLLLTAVVGFKGDTTLNGGPAKTITATSIATQGTTPRTYCILALASSGAEGIHTNGAPNANLAGCNIMSNTTSTCHGHNLGADIGDAHGTNSGCGVQQDSNMPVVPDPYSGLASNIPTVTQTSCAGLGNNITATSVNLPSSCTFVGDVTLTNGQTLVVNTPATASGGSVIYIKDGTLNLNGGTLQTASGSGLTIVFTGSGTATGSGKHASTVSYYPTGGGTLDIAAPTGGAWSGVALYQDPSMPGGSGVDISYSGNSPTWEITGLVYLPHSSVTFSGAVNKSSNGASCFDLVVDNLLINGTGNILAQGQCDQAGLTMPTGHVPGRGKLVS